ncbi:cell wall-binding protein [Clostridium botulinum]|uniref:Cell wall-binding protein n=1 Tax=Clostridium botulinum TaxID=1491 RepID=A0A6B4JNV3_CLOBO|nr:cell wall-binding protein [Clostridium botulinum]EES51215.1 lytic transglycosylase, catalytic [Clostridium botulinum E1 str. 'BoNT E Beluga']MBY6761924.1 cell wall-binding protein [Clostridium botulinum]MBY6920850.1 cell wall-binding protein [Clostridium botulinum]MCR1131401.1 cell wall-binding protein [Clostridium botulinum]NFJ58688.1 cell wall-binding protein [Clostridium botulinum]
MKNFKKLISTLLIVLGIVMLNPVQANAEWKQNNTGWWYTQSSSYAIGWTQIDEKWYFFDSSGYMNTGWIEDNGNWYYCYGDGSMANNCYAGNYYLNNNGVWTTQTNNVNTTNNKGATVYITATEKKYHSIPKCGKTNTSRSASLEEAHDLGLEPCSKCY